MEKEKLLGKARDIRAFVTHWTIHGFMQKRNSQFKDKPPLDYDQELPVKGKSRRLGILDVYHWK